jgi:prephenate dehydratase
LLALPGASLEGLRRIESHPAALAQCRDWLARHPGLRVVVVSDTAGAACDVASSRDWTRAAIASAAAGVRYGLSVLAWNLQDDPQNRTRFWAVARAISGADVPERPPGVRDLGGIPVEAAVARLRAESAARREDGGQPRSIPGALSAGGGGRVEGGS